MVEGRSVAPTGPRVSRPRAAAGVLSLLVLTACDDPASPVSYGECEDPTGVVFVAEGSLTEASSPLSTSDQVSGCVRIRAVAAEAGTSSTDAANVLGYQITIGQEEWLGRGQDMVTGYTGQLRGYDFGFRVSADGDSLVFELGVTHEPSTPSGLYWSLSSPGTGSMELDIRSVSMTSTHASSGVMTLTRR